LRISYAASVAVATGSRQGEIRLQAAPGRHNIEVKARCRDLTRAAEAAREIGATRVGELRQCDTYFCAHGNGHTQQ
jgi:hypothetical protein